MMAKCNNDKFELEEFTCFQCDGKGRTEDGIVCDVCDGLGFYFDACCEEHGLEEELSHYASMCSVCGKRYAGNGYNETTLPCPDCKKKQQTASIVSSQWYLVRKDRNTKPWAYYVLVLGFKTATHADTYATLHQLAGYHPVHGYAIHQYQEDEAAGLAQIIYIDAPASKAE